MIQRSLHIFVIWTICNLIIPYGMVASGQSTVHASEEEDAALFATLAQTEDPARAALIAEEIRRLWRKDGGAAVGLLLDHAKALKDAGDSTGAEQKLTGIVRMWPDFAEGWVLRAEHRLRQGDGSGALEDLEVAAKLDPRHFTAQALLGEQFEIQGAWADALAAYRAANSVYPALPGPADRIPRLEAVLKADE